MWVSKKEVERLSEYVRGISSDTDIRDNKEGAYVYRICKCHQYYDNKHKN